MTPRNAIRKAKAAGQLGLRIVIPKATDTDFLLFMALVEHGYISFVDDRERLVFETVASHQGWSIGGRFSADVLLKKDLPEHDGRRIMDGAHVRLTAIKIV